MNRSLLLRSIWLRVIRFKGKTLVMGLGILLGVFATVLLLSLAVGVRERFRAFLDDAYPADGIVVFAGSGPMGSNAGRRSLKLPDVETLAAETGAREWDPAVYLGPRDIRHEGTTVRVGVEGHSEKAERVRRRSVASGEFFSAADVRSRAAVALIGTTTARELFGGESPLGARIFIDNLPFAIKGVLERQGADPHGLDQDDVVQIPYTTLMDRMSHSIAISAATFRLADRSRVEATSQEFIRILRREHQIAPGQSDDFSVFTSARMQAMFQRMFRTIEMFIPLISGTVFLIAALVILSILQIGMKARRRELGLRKAVGARGRDLQTQIVLEVLAVAAVAAIVGVALAQVGLTALAPLLAKKMGVKLLVLSPLGVAVAIGGALLAGLLGGLLPARKAARLDAVASLR